MLFQVYIRLTQQRPRWMLNRLPIGSQARLVSARGCLCPIFNKQYANKKPQRQADFYDIYLAGGSTKHIEGRHQPSAIMEKIQPSQNQSAASCSSSPANAGSRQNTKYQLLDVQGNI